MGARVCDHLPDPMLEVPELLTNPGFRRTVTTQPLTPQLGSFWRWYESLSEPARLNAIGPVLNKVRAFALSTPMRRLLGQSDGISFTDMIAGKKIVLIPLKKGLLGAEAASLIGSLITASAWQATLARAGIPAAKRQPAWFYIDEFQDVVRLPVDIADMFAQARGLGLGLTLAHQYLGQLTPQIKAAVIGTARTQIVFQLGHHDAKDLAPYFAPLNSDDLAHLGVYEIAVRPCVNGATLAPVTGTTYPMPEPNTDGHTLAQASATRYGMAAADIERALQARVTVQASAGRRSNRIPFAGGGAGGSS